MMRVVIDGGKEAVFDRPDRPLETNAERRTWPFHRGDQVECLLLFQRPGQMRVRSVKNLT